MDLSITPFSMRAKAIEIEVKVRAAEALSLSTCH
jgi:hypothetical protein